VKNIFLTHDEEEERSFLVAACTQKSLFTSSCSQLLHDSDGHFFGNSKMLQAQEQNH